MGENIVKKVLQGEKMEWVVLVWCAGSLSRRGLNLDGCASPSTVQNPTPRSPWC
jgi:hypothetical protein